VVPGDGLALPPGPADEPGDRLAAGEPPGDADPAAEGLAGAVADPVGRGGLGDGRADADGLPEGRGDGDGEGEGDGDGEGEGDGEGDGGGAVQVCVTRFELTVWVPNACASRVSMPVEALP
jgi:hypothetical protein